MRIFIFMLSAAVFLLGCKQEVPRPDDALGTARLFIESSLKGNYELARELMHADSVNTYELNQLERKYKEDMSEKDKAGYRKASIIIHEVQQVSDSIVIINYSNSFKNKKMPIKVIRPKDQWEVDLHYTFTGNL